MLAEGNSGLILTALVLNFVQCQLHRNSPQTSGAQQELAD